MMSNKRAKHKGKERRDKDRNRITLKHKCSRCGNSLPKGQDMCESCAELQRASMQGDFRARPGVTNDQLQDGFPRIVAERYVCKFCDTVVSTAEAHYCEDLS